ncbi:hypothetical protein TURU_028217 [Turdus rufiventris]|nr:hypothetical protein TURU_028217 [Turdus rufiventris]
MEGPIPLDQWDGNICSVSPRSEEDSFGAGREELQVEVAGVKHSSVLSLLAVYAEDSELELDSKDKVTPGAPTGQKGGLVSPGYGEDDFTCLDGDDGDSGQSDGDSHTEKPEAADLKELREVEERDPQELAASFSERGQNMSPDEIKIPPEPPGRCSKQLQDKIEKLYERKMKEGMDMKYIIQKKKAFRNPSIYKS